MIMLLRLARIFIRLLPYLFEESTELWLGYTINLSVEIRKRNANLLISSLCLLTHWLIGHSQSYYNANNIEWQINSYFTLFQEAVQKALFLVGELPFAPTEKIKNN